MSEERRAAFEADLQAAFDDPNLIDTARAAQIAAGVLALLRVWPPAKQFGLLYLTRVLAASSDAVSAALLSVKLPATLLSARAALELGTPAPAPRAARLMALALVTNLASGAAVWSRWSPDPTPNEDECVGERHEPSHGAR